MMDRHLNNETFQIDAMQSVKGLLGNPFYYQIEAENILDHNTVELTLKKEGKIIRAILQSNIVEKEDENVFIADISINP